MLEHTSLGLMLDENNMAGIVAGGGTYVPPPPPEAPDVA